MRLNKLVTPPPKKNLKIQIFIYIILKGALAITVLFFILFYSNLQYISFCTLFTVLYK